MRNTALEAACNKGDIHYFREYVATKVISQDYYKTVVVLLYKSLITSLSRDILQIKESYRNIEQKQLKLQYVVMKWVKPHIMTIDGEKIIFSPPLPEPSLLKEDNQDEIVSFVCDYIIALQDHCRKYREKTQRKILHSLQHPLQLILK